MGYEEDNDCFLAIMQHDSLVTTVCNFDLCKFPKEDEEILPPAELLADYFKKRKALDHEIDKTLAEIRRILGIKCECGRIVKCGTVFHKL